MRVEHGAPHVNPLREKGEPGRSDRPSEKAPSRPGDRRDTVHISGEARDLHAGRAGREVEPEATDLVRLDDERLVQVAEKLKAGFYDSREAERALAEELLVIFGF